MRTVAMLRHFPPVRRMPTATRCPARRSSLAAAARRESLRVLGIGLGLGAAAGGAAVGDAARKRHVEGRDLQELLTLAGIAQALGRARTLQRLSSVLVTLGHGANSGIRMCQNLNNNASHRCVVPKPDLSASFGRRRSRLYLKRIRADPQGVVSSVLQ